MAVRTVLERMKNAWATPRAAVHWGETIPFQLACEFASPASLISLPVEPPEALLEFWQFSAQARLFEDRQYGQWGLAMLSPGDAVEATSSFRLQRSPDYREGDLVVGEFIGDLELLIVRCDPTASDFGSVVVAAEIDTRRDWDTVGTDLGEFLDHYERAQGAKFWQRCDA